MRHGDLKVVVGHQIWSYLANMQVLGEVTHEQLFYLRVETYHAVR